MLISSAKDFSCNKNQITSMTTVQSAEKKVQLIRQNGQIHLFQSSYRGSYSNIIRDSLRNAALGRRVLLVQLMKGGVHQGISNPINLCGNLTWIRSSNSYDQYDMENMKSDISISKFVKEATLELWEYCKKQLLSGEQDQIILDEIFRAVELNIIDEKDLISTLENRFISGDVILTGTTIPKSFLLMADQVTELRS